MKATKFALLTAVLVLLGGLAACSDDDGDGGGTKVPDPKEWHGSWMSAGDNVAPILVMVFNYDAVRVTMDADNTVTLETHVIDGAWTTTEGIYSITETEKSDVLAITLEYPAFSQEGIIQITAGSPDIMTLEAVQTLPDIGAVPRTPATGFGSDATLGTSNIQTYELESETVDPEWWGEWRSTGEDIAPILVSVFNYDDVIVTMRANNTVTLETHVAEGAWSTTEGVYTIATTEKSDVLAISLVYPAFEQEGIIQVTAGEPDMMQLEVVQTVPDIGAVPRTPATGFGSDASLGTLNIQTYRLQ
ncbi:MAG: hypothetical protein GY838_16605 [bacterium]|nr:hypothetical protein [bacterium]